MDKPKLIAESTVDIYGHDCFKVTRNYEDGSCEIRTIAVEDFVNVLVPNTIKKERSIDLRIGKLPKGFYDGTINSDGAWSCIVEVPSTIRCMRHFDYEFLIPYPRLVFCLRANGEFTSADGRVWAIKDSDELTDDTFLYNYPFGNVGSSGSICWGNIFARSKFDCSTMESVELVLRHFFDSETVNHSWNANLKCGGAYSNQLSLLQSLNGTEKFPENLLVRANDGATKVGFILK